MTSNSIKVDEEVEENIIPYANGAFRQQKVSACKPFLTPLMAACIYTIFSVISVIIGASILKSSDDLFEKILDYSDCPDNKCSVLIDTTIQGNLYFYYQLDGFHQNFYTYVKSINWPQLKGKMPNSLDSCAPVERDPQNSSQIIIPCGARPVSMFNDTFTFDTSSNISVRTDGISHGSYRNLFRQINNGYYNSDSYTVWNKNISDEHFINWIQTAPFGKFRKLYAVIDGSKIAKGTLLNFTIEDNFPTSNGKAFKKQIVLAETYFLGGKNQFFGIFFIVLCALSGAAAVVLVVLHFLHTLPLYRSLGKRSAFTLPLLP